MHARHSSRPGQVFSRIVLPLVLFVAVVAGLAWILQYLPNIREREKTISTPDSSQTLIRFENQDKNNNRIVARWQPPPNWDQKYGEYVHETEAEDPGNFDFKFENISDKDLEVGLEKVGCSSCTIVSIAVIPSGTLPANAGWKKNLAISAHAKDGVAVPPGASGIVRVGWEKKPQAILHATLWIQPKGEEGRQSQTFSVPVRTVPPLRFLPDNVELSDFRVLAKGELYCWSSTRDNPKWVIDKKAPAIEGVFEFDVIPQSAKECVSLQEKLNQNPKKSHMTQVKSAFLIKVKVHETKDGKHLDQNHKFKVQIPILFKDRGDEEFLGATLHGRLLSDVTIVGAEDLRISMGSFSSADGKTKVVTLETDPDTLLMLKGRADSTEVSLRKKPGSKGQWELEVSVPPNSFAFQSGGLVTLRSVPFQPTLLGLAHMTADFPQIAGDVGLAQLIRNEARVIRIPVMGTLLR